MSGEAGTVVIQKCAHAHTTPQRLRRKSTSRPYKNAAGRLRMQLLAENDTDGCTHRKQEDVQARSAVISAHNGTARAKRTVRSD